MAPMTQAQVPHPEPKEGRKFDPFYRFVPQMPTRPLSIPKSILAQAPNPHQLLADARRLRKKRYRRKMDAVYDPKKVSLDSLSVDVLYMVFKELDVPSRISLGLTSKKFLILTTLVNTRLSNNPSLIKFHEKCASLPCPLTLHISSRRIFLLPIKTWMPRGFRLCWVCRKYSKVGSSRWHESNAVDLTRKSQINHHAISAQRVRKVWCHHACLPDGARNGREFGNWTWNTQGACGGFGRFTGLVFNGPIWPGFYIYSAGF